MKFKTISDYVQLEVKGLALLRILLSLFWIYSLFARFIFFDSFYSSEGLLPLATAQAISDNIDSLGLKLYWDNNYFTYTLFGLSFLNALVLLIGYRPQIFALSAFILMLFLDSRNQFVLNAGYETLRVLMFWLIFLPSNAKIFKKSSKALQPQAVAGWLAFAFLLQIVCFYFFGGVFKNSDYWKVTGDALEMAFSNRVMSYSWTQLILPPSEWLKWMSRGVYYYELSIGLLLLAVFSKEKLRKIVLSILMIFHVGIFISFKIGFLPLVNIAALLALWPYKKIDPALSVQRPFQKVGLFLILCLMLVNFNSVPWWPKLPQQIFSVSRSILMDQTWMFFAPHPYSFDGWWKLTTKNGQDISEVRITGSKVEGSSEVFYTESVGMEEKTFLIHLLKDNFIDYRKQVLSKFCQIQKADEVNFEFTAADLPSENKKLTYSIRISEPLMCNN